MRWPITKFKNPFKGQVRTKRVFAWFPTIVEDNWIWLEHYTIEQTFVPTAPFSKN